MFICIWLLKYLSKDESKFGQNESFLVSKYGIYRSENPVIIFKCVVESFIRFTGREKLVENGTNIWF